VSTLLKLRDDGTPLPVAGVPISPWVDMEAIGESMTTRADVDVIVNEIGLKDMAEMFLAGHDARDPLAAPLYGDFAGIPPLFIQVGDEETLLDDFTRLAESAEAAGVEVRLDVFPEMQHVFQLFTGNMPEADEAIAQISAWLRPRLGLYDLACGASSSPGPEVLRRLLPVEYVGVIRVEALLPAVHGPFGHDPVGVPIGQVDVPPLLTAPAERPDDPGGGDEFPHVEPQGRVVLPEVGHEVLML